MANIDNALHSLDQIKGVKFIWNDNAKNIGIHSDKVHLGVMAQDVEKVWPEVVDIHNGYLAVNYDKLIPVLIEAIKELKKEVQILKGEK